MNDSDLLVLSFFINYNNELSFSYLLSILFAVSTKCKSREIKMIQLRFIFLMRENWLGLWVVHVFYLGLGFSHCVHFFFLISNILLRRNRQFFLKCLFHKYFPNTYGFVVVTKCAFSNFLLLMSREWPNVMIVSSWTRTTDARRGNPLHRTAKNSLPLPNF